MQNEAALAEPPLRDRRIRDGDGEPDGYLYTNGWENGRLLRIMPG